MMFYDQLNFDDQCTFLAFIGYSLNWCIYEASTQNVKQASKLDFNDLKNAKKSELYESCDRRLKSFIDNLTTKDRGDVNRENFKSNIYENILKARNGKYTSDVGAKEHMVVYLLSGKS